MTKTRKKKRNAPCPDISQIRIRGILMVRQLDLFDGNGVFFANLDTALAAEAFFGIDRY